MGGSPTLSLSGCRKKDSSQATGKQSILPQQASGYQECANAGMAATIATPRTVELYRASVMERLGVRILLEAVLMAAARRCAPSPGVGIGQDFDFVIVSEDRR